MSFIPLPSGTTIAYAGRIAPNGWVFCDGAELSKTAYPELFQALLSSDGVTGIYDTQINPTTGTAYLTPATGNFRLPDFRGVFLRGTGTASGGDATTLGVQQSQKTAKNSLSVSNAQSSVSVSGLKNQLNGSVGVSGLKNQMNNSVSVSGNKTQMDGIQTTSGSGTGAANRGHSHAQYVTANPGTGNINGYADFKGDFLKMSRYDQGVSTSKQSADHTHSWTYGAETFSASGSWGFGTATFSASGSWDFGSSALFSASGTAVAQAATVTGDNETRPVNKGVNYIIKL